MKTLLVDADQAMLQHCVARIGKRQRLAIATSKAQVLSVLRHGPGADVVVVCERLVDGSGLPLLDEIHNKWPHLIRVFCADSKRLALVRTRLGTLRLPYTLPYPLRPAKLEVLLVHLAQARAQLTRRLR